MQHLPIQDAIERVSVTFGARNQQIDPSAGDFGRPPTTTMLNVPSNQWRLKMASFGLAETSSFKTRMICSSVNLLLRASSVSQWRHNPNSKPGALFSRSPTTYSYTGRTNLDYPQNQTRGLSESRGLATKPSRRSTKASRTSQSHNILIPIKVRAVFQRDRIALATERPCPERAFAAAARWLLRACWRQD